MRKTNATLRRLIDTVNHRNRHSTCDPLVRRGWNSILEQALMDANSYAGFGYWKASDLAPGTTPGIQTDNDGNNTFPDETRRFYYVR